MIHVLDKRSGNETSKMGGCVCIIQQSYSSWLPEPVFDTNTSETTIKEPDLGMLLPGTNTSTDFSVSFNLGCTEGVQRQLAYCTPTAKTESYQHYSS